VRQARQLWLALALLVIVARPAFAQRGVDAQLFRPAMDAYGIASVERAEVARQFDFGFSLWFDHAGSPLRLDLYDPNLQAARRQTVIERLTSLHLGLHLGLTDWLQLALNIPVSAVGYGKAYGQYGSAADPTLARTGFYEGAPYTNIPPPDAAPLDTRIGFKARLFGRGPASLALLAVVTLPFGDDSAFLGDRDFTFRPGLAFDLTRGALSLAVNLGAIVRSATRIADPREVAAREPAPRILLEVGHELTYGVGVAVRFVRQAGLFAELLGLVPLVGERRDFTLNAQGGFQFTVHHELSLLLGVGGGLLDGSLRREEYRAFAGLQWAPAAARSGAGPFAASQSDRDGDGLADPFDRCPDEPEDRNGVDDDDGCPDALRTDGEGAAR
jgi:hypothetical protein